MKKALISVLVVSLSGLGLASPLQSLQSLLSPIETLQAEFVQLSFADLSSPQEERTEGELVLAKPDRLYWYAAEPFEQTLVADGEHYWVWDKDLEQVTKEPVGARISQSPAGVLTSGAEAIGERFVVSIDEINGDIESYNLLPVSSDAGFERIVMTFEDGVPAEVEVFDAFGGATMLILNDVIINAPLASDQFSLVIPPGTDVIDMTR